MVVSLAGSGFRAPAFICLHVNKSEDPTALRHVPVPEGEAGTYMGTEGLGFWLYVEHPVYRPKAAARAAIPQDSRRTIATQATVSEMWLNTTQRLLIVRA